MNIIISYDNQFETWEHFKELIWLVGAEIGKGITFNLWIVIIWLCKL